MNKLAWLTAIVVAFSMISWAQKQIPTTPIDPNYSAAPQSDVDAAFSRHIIQQQDADRDLALRKDTDKLLELASELKQNVDRTNPNLLSLDVIRKAQEIEKLAKSVREKMKGD